MIYWHRGLKVCSRPAKLPPVMRSIVGVFLVVLLVLASACQCYTREPRLFKRCYSKFEKNDRKEVPKEAGSVSPQIEHHEPGTTHHYHPEKVVPHHQEPASRPIKRKSHREPKAVLQKRRRQSSAIGRSINIPK